MPCLAVHLAIAEKYLKNHLEENRDDFILGTIAPDIELPEMEKYINIIGKGKNNNHFGHNVNTTDPIEYMKRKVDFKMFFNINDIDTSFKRGYFLHLLSDNLFFKDYVDYKKLEGLNQEQVKIKAYNEYNLITPILIKKYKLNIPDSIKQIVMGKGEGKLEILKEEDVFEFIEKMANINLLEQKNKLK